MSVGGQMVRVVDCHAGEDQEFCQAGWMAAGIHSVSVVGDTELDDESLVAQAPARRGRKGQHPTVLPDASVWQVPLRCIRRRLGTARTEAKQVPPTPPGRSGRALRSGSAALDAHV